MVKICVIFHMGYNADIISIIPYFRKLDINLCYFYSTYRESGGDIILEWLYKILHAQGEILFANKGCDTGAFLLCMHSINTSKIQYEYVLKIHTKRSNPIFINWKSELLDSVLGSKECVRSIINVFDTTKKSIKCSNKWFLPIDIDDDIFNKLLEDLNLNAKNKYFVGGTIFWRKMRCYDFLSKFNLLYYYNLCEENKCSEPSYTHSWERILSLCTLLEKVHF